MITDLKPYPEYKDSGLLWLGKVPKHWEVRRFKYLLREVNFQSSDGQDQLLSVSQYTGVTPRRTRDEGDEPDTRAASLVGYKRVAQDDLVVNIMLAWNGSLGVARSSGIVSPAYCVYRFNDNAEPWYYHNLLRLPLYKGRIKVESTGVVESRLRLYSDDLFRIEALVPPKEEQVAIARFMEAFVRQVDRLIRAKRQLIELLNEQKQAIIHRAVTRGLDPNVRLKPSGIDWLGDVPAHWDVQRLKTVARIIMGQSPPSDECNIDGQGRPFLQGCAEFGDRYPTPVQFCPTAPKVSPAESILLSVRAPVGALNIADQEYGIGRGLCAIEPFRSHLDLDFTLHTIAVSRGQLLRIATGSTYDAVTVGEVGCMRLSFPPLAEQRQIVAHVRVEVQAIDTAIGRANREIELLREYRTRLSADVVTGKIDVRGVELPAMDEAEALENLDTGEDSEVKETNDTEEITNGDE
jgi:type I restriction enzyme S subunit